MDRTGADFDYVVSEMREKLGAYAFPVVLPLGAEDHLQGVIDVISQKAVVYDEADLSGLSHRVVDLSGDQKERAEAAYIELLDAVAERDDQIMELVLEEKPVEPSILKAAIRRLTCQRNLFLSWGALLSRTEGFMPSIDAVIDYLPSPVEVPAAQAHDLTKDCQLEVSADDGGSFCGLAFKLWTDPFVGKLVFIRVYRGTLKKEILC